MITKVKKGHERGEGVEEKFVGCAGRGGGSSSCISFERGQAECCAVSQSVPRFCKNYGQLCIGKRAQEGLGECLIQRLRDFDKIDREVALASMAFAVEPLIIDL